MHPPINHHNNQIGFKPEEKAREMNICKLPKLNKFAALLLLSGGASISQPTETLAFDMDCKVILCIAGGFPAGCGDAYGYMISRITRWPTPLPPFGFCPMSSGVEYTGYDVDYNYLGGQSAYDCPEGKKLHYTPAVSEDGNSTSESAFCYSHITLEQVRDSDDNISYVQVYQNQSQAIPVNFQLKITIEPGTDIEYHSPLFRINTSTGYVSQREG